jgi:hypothetical protein
MANPIQNIPFTKYIDITSSVGGANTIPVTELITRVFSVNPLIPAGGFVLEFTSAAAVGDYFGFDSEEYLRALFYFSWISKTYQSPQKISFSFWAASATAPLIYGANLPSLGTTLADLQAITNGSLELTMGAFNFTLTGLDFSELTFTEIASAIQTAIRAETGGGTLWTEATVSYSNTDGAFNLVGGATGAAVISVTSGISEDISTLMGWDASALIYPDAPIFSNGVAVETITETLTNSFNTSDNFGSFVFTNGADLTQDDIVEGSTWNLSQNNEFIFLVQVAPSNADDISDALDSIGGTGLTLQSPSPVTTTEYPEMVPGMIMAATNYTLPNAVQNYMYQKFNLTASVNSGSVAAGYDAIGVNYYGQTQTNGQILSFYQNGYLSGASVSTNATDMNVYANECWLKNAISAALGTLLLSVSQIPANQQGRAIVINTVQGVVNQALNNGTISVGSLLTNEQIAVIGSVTNDPNAWYQVQDTGYWLDAVISQNEEGNYIITYTLVYKKNDVIRQIVGTDILI